MDEQQFLQRLYDFSLEDGKHYLQESYRDFAVEHATIGVWLEKDALDKLYSPFNSLKLAELLIFFGELVQHSSSYTLGLKAKGDALLQIGHYRAAIENLDAGGEKFLLLGDEGNWARSRISWIVASMWLGHVDEALTECILVDLVYDLSPSFLRSAWAVYEDMIALYLQQGQARTAFAYLERARSLALRQYISRSKAQREQAENFENPAASTVRLAMIHMQGELKDWQERYHEFSLLLANIDLSVSSSVDTEVLRTELKHCEEKIEALFERISLYQESASSAIHQARTAKVKYGFDSEQIRQKLASNQLLLAYFLYQGKIVIFALTSQGMVQHEIPDGVAQLERLLPYLHARLQPAGWLRLLSQQDVMRALLQKLYALLIAPIESSLPVASGLLTIVPYGPLHNLPFHALYNGARFLVEDFQIQYLPAASALTFADSPCLCSSVESKEAAGKSLVFGYSGKGRLEHALEEAKALMHMFEGTGYLENEATIACLMKEAAGSSIIHIATHGQSRMDAPNFSSVLLADGQLNAIDVFNLDLQGCELVTLSGCKTGLSMSGGGDEQLGLGRAFLAAGAEALVMSLWPVEDTITSEFMQIFYRSLLQGNNKAQALREAQCELLARSSSIHAHPYFWAAFRLVGDVRPLNSFAKKHI